MSDADRGAEVTAAEHEVAHHRDVRAARRWGRGTVVFVVVLVVVGSLLIWRSQVNAHDNSVQFGQLNEAFRRLDDAVREQHSLDCAQTAARNSGIKASWQTFLDTFATPEQQKDPKVVRFKADLEARFPPLTCPTSPDTPVVVPIPVSTTVPQPSTSG